MFDEKTDVAEIMRQIKKGVMFDEVKRVTDFLENTNEDSKKYIEIGSILPECQRFPVLIRKIFRFIARVIRRSSRFIARDQIALNYNVNQCISALIERDDAVKNQLLDKILVLEKECKRLEQRLDDMESHILDNKQ